MINSIKKIIKIYLLLFMLMILALPLYSNAELSTKDRLKRCWTKEQCWGQGKNSSNDNCVVTTGEDGKKTGSCWVADEKDCGKDTNLGKCYVKPIDIKLQIPIPGVDGSTDKKTVNGFPEYLKYIYTFFVSAIGFIAVAYVAFGGYQWMTAGGNPEKVNQAKDTIRGAIIGMFLAVGSYFLLSQLNTALVANKDLRVDKIKPALLRTMCGNETLNNVKDWVLESDYEQNEDNATEVAAGKQECNKIFISKSNPGKSCYGDYCPDKDGEKQYCITREYKDGGGYKCADSDDLKDMCEDKDDVEENPLVCESVDHYFENIKAPFVCDLDVGYEISTGGSGAATNVPSKTNIECTAFDLVLPPSYHDTYNVIYTKQIKCKNGSPVCYDNNIKKSKFLCSDSERIGKGDNRMCVVMTEDKSGMYRFKCSKNKPLVNNSEGICNKLDLFLCDYKITNQDNCSGCSDKCWEFVGLTN